MAMRRLAAALLVGLLAGPALAAPPRAAGPPRVSVALISEGASIEPGSPLWVGLRQRIAPGWHTYWLNPGDSGEAPSIEWSLPTGFGAEPIVWPRPERLPVGPVVSYGYTKEVVLLARVTVPADPQPGSRVTLRGRASWLLCGQTSLPHDPHAPPPPPPTARPPTPPL